MGPKLPPLPKGACSLPIMSRVHATYRLHAAAADIEQAALALALEQSVELPLAAVRDPMVAATVVGRVEDITPHAPGVFDVRIGLAESTMGVDVAQTMNMLFGNSSLHAHVELLNVAFTPAQAAAFGGPRFGIAGLRERLGVTGRPLTCAALKPQGLPPAALAALCEPFARGGIDVIKDDHGLADQAYAPFADRVRACQQVVRRVERETGRTVLYAPSLVGSPRALSEQLRIVRDEGVGAVLLAPALIGLPAFHELVQTQLQVPVLAHPSWAGASRVAAPLLLGRLFRLMGADAVIFPNHGGRFAYSPGTCHAIADAARGDWLGLKPTLPVPAGGMTVERVPEVVGDYGIDTMLLVGGSLLLAEDVLARTREFTAAVARQGAAAL
jgi:ribulose-bisphosphate carboxylase large chain